jgi:hypothetical protein
MSSQKTPTEKDKDPRTREIPASRQIASVWIELKLDGARGKKISSDNAANFPEYR